MCLFRYREKRYGKTAFVIFALVMLAIGAAAAYGGVYAFNHIGNWARIFLLVLGIVGAVAFGGFGLFLIGISFSMIRQSKSVRDINKGKGISGTRLCDKCGRVITKHADFCEHCGEKQQESAGSKKCSNCGTKNKQTASFCEKCGTEFKN